MSASKVDKSKEEIVKAILAIAAVLILGLTASARAQAPAGPPKPGPEHKKLDYFAGKWTMDGEMKPSPFGPGGRVTGTDNCEWFGGGFHVVCHGDGKGPTGPMKGLSILGYNTEEKAYTYYGIDSTGMGSGAKGSLSGSVWTWNGEDKLGGKLVKSRYTITQTSPSVYAFKWEVSEDGKTWNAVMEGKETRAAKQ